MEAIALTLAVVGLAILGLCVLVLCAAALAEERDDREEIVRRIRSRGKVVLIPPGVCQSCGAEGFRLTDGRCDGCREADRPKRRPA